MAHDKESHLDTATAPGGELGGTWASPTVDATHSGSAHHTEDHDHDGSPTQTLLAANTHGSPSADTHHAKNHTMTEHEAMGRMVLVRKTADESVSLNTTVQNDDHLSFSIAASEVWVFQIMIIYNSGTVGDFKYQITVPSGATGFTTRGDISTGPLAHGTDSGSIPGTLGDLTIPLMGVVVNSTTAGTVQFAWAQFASDAVNTTVKTNSFLIAHRVA